MNRVTVLPPSSSLVSDVLSRLTRHEKDFSRNLVVFQGKRPAHFLRKEIAETMRTACVPPRILTIDALVEQVYYGELGQSGRRVADLDAIAVLHGLHCTMGDRIGGEHFLRPEAFMPLGQRIFSALEELVIGLVSPSALRSAIAGTEFPNGIRLADFYERFLDWCTTEGCSTRASRYAAVSTRAASITLREHEKVVIAGFFAFAAAEKALFRRLLLLPHVELVFQNGPGLAAHLQEIGITEGFECSNDATVPATFYSAPSVHAEVMGLNAVLDRWRDSGVLTDERSVIMLPSSEILFPLEEWALSRLPDGSYNVSLGYPALHTTVFGFINNVLQLLESMRKGRFSAPAYVAFLLHPYTKNLLLLKRPELMRILAHAVEGYLADRPGWMFVSMEDLETDAQLRAEVSARLTGLTEEATPEAIGGHLRQIHDQFLRNLLGATTIGEYALQWIEVLTFVDEQSTARYHRLFAPFARNIMDHLQTLADSRLGVLPLERPETAGAFLRKYLAEVVVPFAGTPVMGLQVLGLLETRNLRFDRVVVLDMNDDILPGGEEVDPLLPVTVRRHLHMPTSEDSEAIKRYYFDVLIHGADEVHLFYLEGDGKARSRFIERLLWDCERKSAAGDTPPGIRQIQIPFRLANAPPAPIEKTPTIVESLRRMVLSASGVDCYLRCQLRFYYQHVLRLKESAAVDGELDGALVGEVVHAVLREMDFPLCGRRLEASADRANDLDAAIEKVFSDRFGREAMPAAQLTRRQIRQRLDEYLGLYSREVLAREEVTLLDVETQCSCEWNGALLRGVIDRIERRGNLTVITDFKTAAKGDRFTINFKRLVPDDPETWRHAKSLQLPFYTLLYSGSTGVAVDMVAASYVILGGPKVDPGCFTWLFGSPEYDEQAWTLITATLRNIIAQMRDPARAFTPPADLQNNCPDCPFTAVCGTAWVRGWQ